MNPRTGDGSTTGTVPRFLMPIYARRPASRYASRIAAMYSTSEVCEAAGISFRQIDMWVRTGIIVPTVHAHGTGTARRFDEAEVRVVRFVRDLRRLGCIEPAISAAAARARQLPWDAWFDFVYVDDIGRISVVPLASSWVIDLGACAQGDRTVPAVRSYAGT